MRGFNMGRSVSYPKNTIAIAYNFIENEYDEDGKYEEFLAELDWWDLVDNFIHEVKAKYKSMRVLDEPEFIGREDVAYLENDFAYVGISEYCGLSPCGWL
jgi:hypothetical protein